MTSQLVEWYKKNKADKFELIMVTGDRSEKAMLKYMKGKKINFPALSFKDTKIGHDLGFKAYPWLTLVDEKGEKVVSGVAFKLLKEIESKLK